MPPSASRGPTAPHSRRPALRDRTAGSPARRRAGGNRFLIIAAVLLLAWMLGLHTVVGDIQRGVAGLIGSITTATAPPPVPRPIDPCALPGAPPPVACADKTRPAIAPNPQGEILHAPSVSVRAIWLTLLQGGSPLADDTARRGGRTYAQYIWDAGRASGVDPAILMGMFNVESHYGRDGVARLTHSPGNMRVSQPGQPAIQGYASYPDWFAGIDATDALLRRYAGAGMATVDAAIPTWAPSSDHNDTAAYIVIVHDTMAAIAALNG